MKVTVILGSPRKKQSASYRLAQHFITGLRKAGAEVEEIMLADCTIKHCIGCYTCWIRTPGRCVHRDDMEWILPKLRTDLVVYATPLYYFTFPGLMKDALDRQLPLVEPDLIERDGITSHPFRGGGEPPGVFLIAAAGFPERSHFDALVATAKKIFGEDRYRGEILVAGSEPISKDELQDAYLDLFSLVERAGYEVGKDGRVSEETGKALLEKTSYPPEKADAFRKIANDYWKSFQPIEPERKIEKSAEPPLQITARGLSGFMAGMAAQYRPGVIPGLTAALQFDLDGKLYHLVIDGPRATAHRGRHPSPTTTITCGRELWLEISSGQVDGAKALMEGRYRVDGNLRLLTEMDRLFGGEEEEAVLEQAAVESIPEQRGTIGLSGSAWMFVAFIPWIIVWVGGSIAGGWLPRIVAAAVALTITAYHLFTNRPTLFEAGSTLYLAVTALVHATGQPFFFTFARVIDYLFLGGLWLGSSLRAFPLTGEYSRYGYPKVVWRSRAFIATNLIITDVWGLYFLLAAFFSLLMVGKAGPPMLWMIVIYLLLIPMFTFTGWFQKYYPERIMKQRGD